MRFLLLIAALLACTAAPAQIKPMVVHPPAHTDDPDERRREARERDRNREHQASPKSSARPMTVVRPPRPDNDDERSRWQERDERRAVTPSTKTAAPANKPSSGAAPMIVVRPTTPSTPPSKAEQLQRQMDQERRNQRGEQALGSGNFRCTAYPVCDRSSGSYGSCRGVEQQYSAKSARFARQQVARDCAAVNTPDPCNCAAQCSRVAQCGAL